MDINTKISISNTECKFISQVRTYVHLIADHVTTPGSYTDNNPGVGGRGALRFINEDEYV